MTFQKIMRILFSKLSVLLLPLLVRLQRLFSDKAYVKLYFWLSMHKRLNLESPHTFNEKLNWLKLYDHNPLYTTLVDKYAVKEWVAGKIGKEYVIPTIGVWDKFEEIDFDSLPNGFVLKTTHGGGNVGVVVCKDKNNLDVEATHKIIEHSMGISGYEKHREWPYKNVPRRIIAEELLIDSDNVTLIDYKVHVFNGIPRFILVCRGREHKSTMTDDFFDTDWILMNCNRPGHKNSQRPIDRPPQLGEMLEIASKLSDGIPFVRVDFYIVDNHLYFGEMTFFPAGAAKPFVPEYWDTVFGEWLYLPNKHA